MARREIKPESQAPEFHPKTVPSQELFSLADMSRIFSRPFTSIHYWLLSGRIREAKRTGKRGQWRVPRHEVVRIAAEEQIQIPGLWMPPKKLLLVDDNPAIRAQLVAEFTRRNVPLEVKTVAAVAAGMKIAEKWKPDVIAVDYFYPEKRGGRDQVLAFIRKAKGLPSVKVVGISAYPDVGPKMLGAGAVAFLAKPIKNERFKNLVFELAASERRERKRELRRPLEGVIEEIVEAS